MTSTPVRSAPGARPDAGPAPTPAEAVTAADAHPLVRRVRAHAEAVLRPSALRTDRDGVPAERVAELRALGLLDLDVDVATGRRLHEVLAGACFATWLVWTQHAPLAARVAASGIAGPTPPLVARVLRGDVLLGAGVSDVRRYPQRFVAATRTAHGWTVRGTLSWVSGWGLSSALVVAAVEPGTETVVTALVEVGERTRATPLELSALGGSRTVRVDLDDVPVAQEHVLAVEPLQRWRRADLATASDARPHHFGLAQTVLAELDADEDPRVRRVAQVWRPRVESVRERAYALADAAASAGGGAHRLEERLATKVASGDALSTLTRALLAARSGRGLTGDDTAQLHARSALFVLVQGQSADVRRAQLDGFAR